jgi:group I intron endonuclease
MKCETTEKMYVGQTVSHRKNHGKYRPYGFEGRFKAHLCEAIKNTKANSCTYLDNAIRKYGVDVFSVTLLENCKMDEMDEKERHYIKKYNTIAPNGYNITAGGKGMKGWVNPKTLDIDGNQGENIVLKRGREHGFKHTETTKQKLKQRHAEASTEEKQKRATTMRKSITEHFNKHRTEMLLKIGITFEEDFHKYIRPKKKDNKIVGYVIRINRARHGEIVNTKTSLQEKYDTLYKALEDAYNIQQSDNN